MLEEVAQTQPKKAYELYEIIYNIGICGLKDRRLAAYYKKLAEES